MNEIKGIHHVTAIAGPAQENLDFYAGVLGLRLVKKSVNQDDPGTYHLFYADAEGHPGTDLTFFPWAQMAPSREGYGLSNEVSLAVPPGSLGFWNARLERYGVAIAAAERRFGQDVLPITDPHGLHIALVESEDSLATAEPVKGGGGLGRTFTPWDGSPIPVEHQIRGLESARMVERDLVVTTSFLSKAMGFTHLGSENGWHRYGVGEGKSGAYVDLRETPADRRGAWGTGSIHHIAWRVDDEAHQLEVRTRVAEEGARPTPVIDRFWFKSVYFLEPGGVLFELATDGPGFAVDEDRAHLGETLVLPPWLEPNRAEIEAKLPPLKTPSADR
ncbi:MAG TPA: ring-cleaving dioxygenase [Chthoniobacterales bacterium]|nr:ring-cleaving dioxygenase [Chthoniobacterales bacterium]